MNDFISLIQLPFVQRALIGGILVAVTASLMGVLVVLRRAAFYGDAIAHASLTGVALGLLLGGQPVLLAAGYAVVIALLLPWLEKKSQLPLDSLLGFLLPVSMALGVVLLSLNAGFQADLMSYLFGSILSISWSDIGLLSLMSLSILCLFLFFRRTLLFSSFDPEYAAVLGLPVFQTQRLYHVLLALTIVASIQVVGVVLVNALLIIPASTARLFSHSLTQMIWLTPLLAILATLIGVGLSISFNLPAGPAIALSSGSLLILAIFFKKR